MEKFFITDEKLPKLPAPNSALLTKSGRVDPFSHLINRVTFHVP